MIPIAGEDEKAREIIQNMQSKRARTVTARESKHFLPMEAKAKEETTRQETDKARETWKHKSGKKITREMQRLDIKQTGKKARRINLIAVAEVSMPVIMPVMAMPVFASFTTTVPVTLMYAPV